MAEIKGVEIEEKQKGNVTAEYAGFWMRLGAYIIDGIILNAINYIIYFVPGFIYFAITGKLGSDEIAPTALAVVVFLLCLIVCIAYPVCFWQWRGQTPGKMALGIKIIRTDGSDLTWGSAFVRFLGYIVSTIIIYIGFIWIAFDNRKQGIHDKIADTYVIKLPPKRVILPETYG